MSTLHNENTWSSYPSLLSSLTPEQQRILEDAVCAGLCGRYDECDQLYTQLSEESLTSAVILNRVDMLSNASREYERLQLLNDFADENSKLPAEALRALIRLMTADSNFYIHGIVDELQSCLTDIIEYFLERDDIGNLSDVEIRCITMFYEATNTLAWNSNFVESANTTCLPIAKGDRYAETYALRLALQKQQRKRFLTTIFQLEVNAAKTPSAMSSTYQAAMDCARMLTEDASPVLQYRGAVLSSFLAQKLNAMNMTAMANQQIQLRDGAMQRITPTKYATWTAFCPRMASSTDEDVILSSANSVDSKVESLDRLLQHCQKRRDYTRANQIHITIRNLIDKAIKERKGYEEDGSLISLMSRRGLSFIEFHRNATKMAYFEAGAITDHITKDSLFRKTYREAYDLLTDFLARHPSMAIPYVLDRVYDTLMTNSKALGNQQAYDHYKACYELNVNDCPFNNSEGGGLSDDKIIDPDYAHRVISAEGSDTLSCGRCALYLMLRWAAYESSRGELSAAATTTIFNVTDLVIETASAKQLEQASKQIFTDICGTTEALSSSTQFIDIYVRLLTWLNSDRLPSRSERLFALKYFLQARLFLHRQSLMMIVNSINTDPSASKASNEKSALAFKAANEALTKEEDLLLKLIDVSDNKTGANPTEMDEIMIQRALRCSYRFSQHETISIETIDTAIKQCRKLIAVHKASSGYFRWYHSCVQLIRLQWQKIIHLGRFTSDETKLVLASVKEADEVAEIISHTLSSSDASDQLVAEIKNADEFMRSEHFRFAFAALYCQYKTMISKSGHITAEIQDVINEIADQSLLAKGRSLKNLLQKTQLAQQRFETRNVSGSVDGSTSNGLTKLSPDTEQLNWKSIFSLIARDVAVVDLVDTSYNILHPGLIALLYKKQGSTDTVRLVELHVTNAKVKDWVSDNLEGKYQDEPLSTSESQSTLDQLGAVFEPFLMADSDNYISPDYTVLWSSSGSLHRVPVHAISVGDVKLFQRNPFVYVQSLSLLAHNHSYLSEVKDNSPNLTTILNPLEPSWKSSAAAKEIADILGDATMLHGTQITVDAAVAALNNCKIFNYLGHAEFDREDQWRPYLRLGGEQEGRNISVEEILRLVKLDSPALCTLFACGSGRFKVTTTDDLLSLPTALQVAGATSVVSTFWPVLDVDAARISRKFYQKLLATSAEVSTHSQDVDKVSSTDPLANYVNLAKVMQETLIAEYNAASTEQKQKLYHWAGFFIQGTWLFPPVHGKDSVSHKSLPIR